jgi:hypothetical protein
MAEESSNGDENFVLTGQSGVSFDLVGSIDLHIEGLSGESRDKALACRQQIMDIAAKAKELPIEALKALYSDMFGVCEKYDEFRALICRVSGNVEIGIDPSALSLSNDSPEVKHWVNLFAVCSSGNGYTKHGTLHGIWDNYRSTAPPDVRIRVEQVERAARGFFSKRTKPSGPGLGFPLFPRDSISPTDHKNFTNFYFSLFFKLFAERRIGILSDFLSGLDRVRTQSQANTVAKKSVRANNHHAVF